MFWVHLAWCRTYMQEPFAVPRDPCGSFWPFCLCLAVHCGILSAIQRYITLKGNLNLGSHPSTLAQVVGSYLLSIQSVWMSNCLHSYGMILQCAEHCGPSPAKCFSILLNFKCISNFTGKVKHVLCWIRAGSSASCKIKPLIFTLSCVGMQGDQKPKGYIRW